jgi:hypothetical protein
LGLLIIIAGPLLLFSELNPLVKNNYIYGANVKLEIYANKTRDTKDGEKGAVNKYLLFETSRFNQISQINDKCKTILILTL